MARIIDAFSQFFDDNGDPLVDGWLKFTVSGTNNTDKDTFADSAETIPNANPVQLDGAGRCPNVFGTGSYRVVSYADNGGVPGVQIQQFDPVGGEVTGVPFSEWLSSSIYGSGDLVIGSDDKYYRSLVASNQNNDPTISPQQWEEVQLTGVYNQYITYAAGEVVIDSSGYLYRSLQGSNLNNTPSDNPDYWGEAILQTDLLATTLPHNMASDADYTLTTAENRNGRVIITDTGVVLTTGRNIIVSTTQRVFIAQNDTAQTLTFKTLSGTGIAVTAGNYALLVCDGTNVENIVSVASETVKGLAEIATQAEVDAGTDTERYVTPATLSSYANAGKWMLIESWTPTAVASKDFTWDETAYSAIYVDLESVAPATDNVDLYMRLGYGDGGTIITSNNYGHAEEYLADGVYTAMTSVVTATNLFDLSNTINIGSAAGEGVSGGIILRSPAGVVNGKSIDANLDYLSSAGAYIWKHVIGHIHALSTTPIDTVRLYWSSGNYDTVGQIRIYGLRKS